jgi:dihydrofolate reductase
VIKRTIFCKQMRKVILSVAVSLDGFIEFMSCIDTIFFGRKSFEMMGPSAFPGKKIYVFSKSKQKIDGKDVHLVGENLLTIVTQLKKEEGKDIWLFGGASLITTFINEGLVDEMWLGLVSVVLGDGKPLFQNINSRNYFSVTEAKMNGGFISAKYKYKVMDSNLKQ